MDETATLRSVIQGAIDSFCMDNGLALPVGFVYCVSRIDKNGRQVLTLGGSPDQATHVSLGLTHYLRKKFECDVVDELESLADYTVGPIDEDD